jgi:hypothetical protein
MEKRVLVEVEKKMATTRAWLLEKGREHEWSGAVEPEKRMATTLAREGRRSGYIFWGKRAKRKGESPSYVYTS